MVMRRTMTGSYEDCGDVEADNAEEAQKLVDDGPGVYRLVKNPEAVVSYVTTIHTVVVQRQTSVSPPPLEPDEVVSPNARAELERGLAQQQGRQPSLSPAGTTA